MKFTVPKAEFIYSRKIHLKKKKPLLKSGLFAEKHRMQLQLKYRFFASHISIKKTANMTVSLKLFPCGTASICFAITIIHSDSSTDIWYRNLYISDDCIDFTEITFYLGN